MATIKGIQSLKVFVDGYEAQFVHSLDMTRDLPYAFMNAMNDITRAKITIKLDTAYMNMEFEVDYYEVTDTNVIHIYGPLRKTFPHLFIEKELSPWQKAYIKTTKHYKYGMEYKYNRGDSIFNTRDARWFMKGYNAK